MLTLRRGAAQLVLDPELGGRATSLTIDGLELLGGRGGDPVEHGWYPMAPWPGRIRGNTVPAADGTSRPLLPTYGEWALHGTVLAVPWLVEAADESSAFLSCPLGPDWPWPGTARQTWALGDGWLDCVLEVRVEGAESYPVELGWHPWFRRRLARGGPARVRFDADAQVERGPDHLPTGRLVPPDPRNPADGFDDAFRVPGGAAEIVWPGALVLACASDCGWFTVFSELEEAVCLEPQTAPADALATAPRVPPGQTRSARARWSWRADAGPST